MLSGTHLFLPAVTATAVCALSSNPLVRGTVWIGVVAAGTVLLGAGWWIERRRAGHGDPLVGPACVAVLQQQLQRMSASLSHLTRHDPLTGLANRSALNERLAEARASGAGAPTSVLLLDVDDFKLINDSLGHAAGDLLLLEVARRIELDLRSDDRTGRLGGDEFVVLLVSAGVERAQALAERLLTSLSQPMQIGGTEVSVSVSVGIATSNEVPEGLNLLGAADMAMYLAKQRGKAVVAVYEPQMEATASERLTLEADLRRAVRGEELFLAYQPIVDLKTGALAGVEALVRWTDPARAGCRPSCSSPSRSAPG